MVAPQIQTVFDGLPDEIRSALFNLRKLILDTASENPAIGPLEETLKWGEPAYLPSATKSGTTIRINRHKGADNQYALYVNCRTDLVGRWRELYGDIFRFEDNRAIIFNVDEELPAQPVKHCIAMALTYHLR